MLKSVKKEYISVLEFSFKIAYLLLGLATFNSYLYASPVQPLLVKLCLVLGVLALLGRILFFKDYIKTPYWVILMLFCVSFLISILINRAYGDMVADLKWLAWTGMLFFLLYVFDSTRSRAYYKKQFSVMAHIIIVYSALAALAGLLLMVNLYSREWYTAQGEQIFAGFRWERLWGVYTDPNYGAVFSVAAILLCVYFFIGAGWKRKMIYAVCIAANYLYMTFSDSRTAEVCFVVAAGFWIIYTAAIKLRPTRGVLAGVAAAIVFAAVFLGVTSYVKSQTNVQIQAEMNKQEMKKQAEKVNSGDKNRPKPGTSERKTEISKDVSSGRFALWKSGIEVWETRPVFGTGYNSFLPYAKEKLPKTYAVNNPQGEYVSLHNTYINTLVYQGLAGVLLLIAFLALIVVYWWKNIRYAVSQDRDYIAVLTACILVILVSMVFVLEGLYTNSPGSFILWSFLGYLVHDMHQNKRVEKNQ